jgi:hypothetical protein
VRHAQVVSFFYPFISTNGAVGKSFKELATEIGIRWKSLSDEDREPYLLSASTDKERYEREKEELTVTNVSVVESPSKRTS